VVSILVIKDANSVCNCYSGYVIFFIFVSEADTKKIILFTACVKLCCPCRVNPIFQMMNWEENSLVIIWLIVMFSLLFAVATCVCAALIEITL
jgi:hypothetical protein